MTAPSSLPRARSTDLLPLAPFLASLESDGIRATLHDHERIHLALRARGPWTAARLRDLLAALLAQDAEQAALMHRRFEAFFKLDDEGQLAFREVDVERVKMDLQALAKVPIEGPRLPRRLTPPRPPTNGQGRRRKRRARWAALAIVVVAGLGFGIWKLRPPPAPPAAALSFIPPSLSFGNVVVGELATRTLEIVNDSTKDVRISRYQLEGDAVDEFIVAGAGAGLTLAPGSRGSLIIEFRPLEVGGRSVSLAVHHSGPPDVVSRVDLRGGGISMAEAAPEPAMRDYQVPVVTDVRPLEGSVPLPWKRSAWIAAALLLLQAAFGAWLWWLRQPPKDEAPEWDPDAPRLFRTARLGGDPSPWLDKETLDRLADTLGYFRSEETGRELDVDRSIEATGRAGGIPRPVFEQRKRVRSVLVLEDAFAEPRSWNPIAGELARGLARRGVPVVHGTFRGTPELFRTTDGREVALEDLEDERRGYLLLIFSDGKGLTRRRHGFILERLANWPQVAWMELRERRAWDESAALPARYGLPIYPANRDGLVRALGRFATERGAETAATGDVDAWRGRPTAPASELGAHDLERLLGGALPWAQSCSMMTPPLSLGFADALRRRFYPEVPPERVERLLALPGVSASSAGLRFSRRLMALLRRGFLARNDDDRQREVLEFLTGEVLKEEPDSKDSLEHHVWEWKLERLRLELEPDRALERIAELGQGQLGDLIRRELDEVTVISGPEALEDPEAAGRAPLRFTPASRRGKQRLLLLAASSGVSRREAYPVGVRHWALLAVLGFGWMAAAGHAAWLKTWPSDLPGCRWRWAPGISDVALELETLRQGSWEPQAAGLLTENALTMSGECEFGRDHRVHLRTLSQETGLRTSRQFSLGDQHLVLEIGMERTVLPCEEELANGSMIYRCAPGGDVPVDPPGPRATIGLKITDSLGTGSLRLHEMLWEGEVVDQVYVLFRQPDARPDGFSVVSGLERLRADWDQTFDDRLIWWSEGPEPKSGELDILPQFAEITAVGRLEDLTPVQLAELLPEIVDVIRRRYPEDFAPEPPPSDCDFSITTKATPNSGPAPLQVELSVAAEGGDGCGGDPVARWDSMGEGRSMTVAVSIDSALRAVYAKSAKPQVEVAWGGVVRRQTVDIDVVQPEVDCDDFQANPSTILRGGSTNLTWQQPETTAVALAVDGVAMSQTETDEVRPEVVGISVSPVTTTTYGLTYYLPSLEPRVVIAECQTTVTVTEGRQAGDRIVEEAIDMALDYAPPGTFMMGSPEDEPGRDDDETRHQVEITRGFWIGETEVTQGQWQQMMGNNPSRFENCGPDCPVEQVSWFDAVAFANRLSEKAGLASCYEPTGCVGTAGVDLECETVTFQGLSCRGYRLPTEAEWEYAARAGAKGPFSTGEDLTTDQANYRWTVSSAGQREDRQRTVEVRSFNSNPWGLHEVHGNVWEWTWDLYDRNYGLNRVVDPLGPDRGTGRAYRGGGIDSNVTWCRASYRRFLRPGEREAFLGFRLARTAD